MRYAGIEYDGPAATPAQVDKKKLWEKVAPDLATDGDAVATWQGHALVTSAGPCTAMTIKGGALR